MTPNTKPHSRQPGTGDWIAKVDRQDIVAILDNAPLGIVINGPQNHEVLYINKACVEISGYTPSDISSSREVPSILLADPAEAKRYGALIENIMYTGRAEGAFKIVCKDGRLKNVDVRAVCLRNHCVVSMWTDVSRQVRAEAFLEERLKERTAGLVAANQRLHGEIREKHRVEKELERSREELRRLSEHIQCAREEERTRIAREVHDQMGQTLSALKIDINCLGQNWPPDHTALKQQIGAIENQIDAAIRAVRQLCTELRPTILDDFGLTAAMEWYLEEFQQRTGIKCRIINDPDFPETAGKEIDLLLYRILQEALTNTMRHSDATEVTVNLNIKESGLVLKVKDNGRGFSRQQIAGRRSFGLIGIRERVRFRGGRLRLNSSPGKGASMRVSLPFSDKRKGRKPAKHSAKTKA